MDSEQQSRRAQGLHYVFRREQILNADLGVFGERYDPSRLTDEQLRPLFGSASLELDWGGRSGDAFVIPESRRFVQSLHQKCPWLGFFLAHDEPFGSPASLGQFPFLGSALCVSDLSLWAKDRNGLATMEVNQHQLRRFRTSLFSVFATLEGEPGSPSWSSPSVSWKSAHKLDACLGPQRPRGECRGAAR
jgi:hypothetical protein